MKRTMTGGVFILLTIIAVFMTGCVCSRPENTLSQVSTIDALLAGVYDGEVSLRQLLRMGDTGIGTFDCLDGEMIVLDGKVYQVRADGKVYTPPLDVQIPFASVIAFQPERHAVSRRDLDCTGLKQLLDELAPEKNLFYAFKIKGRFRTMQTRSVPRQKKPFPPLAEVVKHQPVFKMKNISGTIIGFRCPPYVKGINVPGYHLHFLSDDCTQGSHVLQFEMQKGAAVMLDCSNKFFMVLPVSGNGFNQTDLNIDRSRELYKAEH
ncbi:MAG: acetolactate decarboxylase [Victivallales bacterium]|nr:acetolactate decarboxylase [Victivallales bacterium]